MPLIKNVTTPLTIDDLDDDIQSETIYQIIYDKSSIKGVDLIKYITSTGIKADINFSTATPQNDIFSMVDFYMNYPNFIHIKSINNFIFNCICYLKGFAISDESVIKYVNSHKDLLNKWIEFYDSYFIYMLLYVQSSENIKERFGNRITNENSLSPNVVSLLLDDFFYDYAKNGINNDNVKYWTNYFEVKYDNKAFNEIMLNPNNDYIITLASIFNKDYEIFKKIALRN